MQLSDPPTPVFACNNKMTLGLMRALYELRVCCPECVSVLGFDDFDWTANFTPRLTTVAQPTLEMGKQAVRMLVGKMRSFKEGSECGEEKVLTLKRDSTTPPRPISIYVRAGPTQELG
jgi:DNA-binding LacI/PurR family transcriptional regulator